MKRVSLILVVLVGLTLSTPAYAAVIEIPRIQLRDKIYNNVDLGPAWWPNSKRPGRGGQTAIAAHRTTHSKPFSRLDRLQKGDRIRVYFGKRKFLYRVTQVKLRPWYDQHIVRASRYETLTLSTCHPPGSASYRLVVVAIRVL